MTTTNDLGARLASMTRSLPRPEGVAYQDRTEEQHEQDRLASIATKLEEDLPTIVASLPAQFSGERMAGLILNQVRKNPRLALCSQASLLGAILTCAQLGLEPGDATGEAYLIPRSIWKPQWEKKVTEATFQIGYKGMTTLFWRHPLAGYLHSDTVREGDDFDYAHGTTAFLTHRTPRRKSRDRSARGEPTGEWYAAAKTVNGGFAFTVLETEEVEERRQASDSPNSPAWKGYFHQMAEKSCIRDLFDELPKERETRLALAWEGQVRTEMEADAFQEPPRREQAAEPEDTGDAQVGAPPQEQPDAQDEAWLAGRRPWDEQ